MRNCNKDRACGDAMPQKWLAKVTMGSAYSFLIALLCVACSREQEEIYQDPYADPNVKVGQKASRRSSWRSLISTVSELEKGGENAVC